MTQTTPRSPLPWMSSLGDVVGADKAPVVLEISAQNADYIVQACNAYPGHVEEIARLRERVALLDSLLGEALRHKYIDETSGFPELADRSAPGRDKHHGPTRPITCWPGHHLWERILDDPIAKERRRDRTANQRVALLEGLIEQVVQLHYL
jgi:hypothetical protein